MNRKILLVLCAAVLLCQPGWTAQFVEVAAEFEITSWRYQEETGLPMKRNQAYAVRCVVGTNMWLIENRSRTNATESVWFMDGKIIRQTTYAEDPTPAAEDPVYRGYRRLPRASILMTADGYPGGDLFLNLPWFAFCSGPYLSRPGGSVPLPTPGQDRAAFGFKGEATVFEDSLGLPKRATFHTAQGQLKCDYQVQKSTNILGWNFPIAFTVGQNEPDSLGKWNRQLSISGRVTSIRPAKPIELPEAIQERLQYEEQFPTRRR